MSKREMALFTWYRMLLVLTLAFSATVYQLLALERLQSMQMA
jgi:hypothetical protein